MNEQQKHKTHLIVFKIVTSCPPPGPAVEVKAPAYLPARAPVDQREEVESQKAWGGGVSGVRAAKI
jgi:hypothetical protein